MKKTLKLKAEPTPMTNAPAPPEPPSENGGPKKKRAFKVLRKIALKHLLVTLFASAGIAVDSEVLGLALICGGPLIVAMIGFASARMFRGDLAAWVKYGGFALFGSSIFVLLRGLYSTAEPAERFAALSGQVMTGVPSGVWAGLFADAHVPLFHALVAILVAAMGVFSLWLWSAGHVVSPPPKGANAREKLRARPRRATQVHW